jgi:YD repeat-containing protein
VLSQQLNASYAFDAAGNRVKVDDGQYSYDASGRMTRGYDGKRNEVVSEIRYDGYGNRVSETEGGSTTTYTYDAGNRVRSSSAGEAWEYDANGNTTYQKARDGDTTRTEYNAENRSTKAVATADGKTSTSTNSYDAVGNVIKTRVDGDGYGFDEVTLRDVRYLEQSKCPVRVSASLPRSAAGLFSRAGRCSGALRVRVQPPIMGPRCSIFEQSGSSSGRPRSCPFTDTAR